MPFYRCVIPKGSLSFEQRQEIAVAFTDVHCGISTAPRNFVNVVFLEVSGGSEIRDSHGRGVLRYDTPVFHRWGQSGGETPRDEAEDSGRSDRQLLADRPDFQR